ncbi:hypothetical protein [methane-oxidizing endosymbiont of Gigantopelta aegis]|uniref:hypothetical protein n=1 Tax=methane-oxidizing endosymbiont of Gigantopelta aegis TaxID=2794938 RepID=UPI0018DB8A52|nr:hypothetical protein [methane-oxidizing endosymbiont of Gigantopelta aegis]
MRPLVLFLTLLVAPSVSALDAKILIIAHLPETLILPALPKEKIKNIYLLKQRAWSDEAPIIVVNRPSDSRLRQQFEHKLGLNSKKYAWYLKKMYYKGIPLPIIQNSKKAVLSFVEQVPGAIAYIEGSLPDEYPHITVLGQLQ